MKDAGRSRSSEDLEASLRDAFDDTRLAELPAGFFDPWPEALPARPRFSFSPRPRVVAAAAIAASLIVGTGWIALGPASTPIAVAPTASAISTAIASTSPSAWPGSSLPPGVVAWTDATPPPSAAPTPPSADGLPACSLVSLDLRFTGWEGVSGGTIMGGVIVGEPDPGAPRCALAPIATLWVLDGRGQTLSIATGSTPYPPILPVVIDPGLPLPPEHDALLVGQASFGFVWSNWCGQDPGPRGTLVISVPRSRVRRLAIDLQEPTCTSAGAPSTMTVQPIEPAEPPDAAPPPWSVLTTSVQAPSVAVAGVTLRYFVTVRNPTDQPVPLDPCPAYVQRLFSGNATLADGRFLLNCPAAPTIPAGGSVTFEMLVDIPSDAPAGPGILFWAGDGVYGLPGPKLPITIAPPGTAIGSVPPATLSPSQDQLDRVEATRIATAFETARAAGAWPEAWAVLSPFSQKRFGSLSAFGGTEAADNAAGAADFVIGDPSRDPDLLDPAFLGEALFFDLKGNAQLERAWLVGVRYPGVTGASAGSEDLVVAPLADGTWRVWIR